MSNKKKYTVPVAPTYGVFVHSPAALRYVTALSSAVTEVPSGTRPGPYAVSTPYSGISAPVML